MNIIAAIDKNRGIGHNGELLVSIPFDRQLFRRETMGKTVVMGRKTFESLPGRRPLDGRTNIVLTHDTSCKYKGAKAVHSLEEALTELEGCADEDIYIIGGESIYRQFLPYAKTAHLTEIDYVYDADVFFPKLPGEEWKLADSSDEQTYFDLVYYFRRYERISGGVDRR